MVDQILQWQRWTVFVFTCKHLRPRLNPLEVIVALAILLAGDAKLLHGQPVGVTQKVGPGVIETLQREGAANVVIMLEEPPSMHARRIDLPTLKSEIAGLQYDVLYRLYPSDYRERHRYQAVPALAGTVKSESGLAKLVAHSNVVRIDLDVGGTGGLRTSVPLIGADKRHDQGITGDGVVVAVLDTGLDTDHADLGDDLIHQECFLDDDGTIDGAGRCPNGSDRQSGAGAAEDGIGHGTQVTGIITSKGTVSSVGVAPDAQIVSIKITDDTPPAGRFVFFSEIVAALDFIINDRPDINIINMSIMTDAMFAGDCDNATAFNMAAAAAINTLRANGVIAFGISGNNGSGTTMTSPGCLSNVVSVGATNDADDVAGLTNSNASLDIMAPGINITSTGLANGTATGSGTSFASPHAAGCAALLIHAGVATTPDEIEKFLETSRVEVTDPTNSLTFPRIDCGRFVAPGDHQITGVLDAAGFRALISPGSIVSVFGNFVEITATASSIPLSMNLNGFSVTFNDIPGGLFGVFDGTFDQSNVQVPWNADVSSGKVEVKVHWKDDTDEVWTDPFEVDAALASPGIYMFPAGTTQAIVTNFKPPGDNDVIANSWAQPLGSIPNVVTQPAAIGGVVTLWCDGLGPVSPLPATGDLPMPPGTAPVTDKIVRVFVGGLPAQVLGAVLQSSSVGLNQINAVIPDGVTPGDAVPIVIEVECADGTKLRSREDVTIAVRPAP